MPMVRSIWPESNGGNKPLPAPNVVVAWAGTPPDQLSPKAVKGILVNPIYTGVGPFPRLVEDAAWVRGLRQVDRGGRAAAIPGQPTLRPAGVLSGGIDGMKVKTTYLQMFARSERVVPPPREGLTVVHARK